jgi:hypothetical protein
MFPVINGLSRDSGCSLIHPDPNEATTACLISSAVGGILFRVLFTVSRNLPFRDSKYGTFDSKMKQ